MSRRATQPEQVSELDQFVGRLRLLGATDEEVAVVIETWDDFDEEFTIEQRTAVTQLSDDELRAELLATRQEYRHDTRTEGEQEQVEAGAHMTATRAWASDIIGQPVAKVLEQVGEDAIRAIAVLDLELGPDGAKRKTLVEPLQALVAGSDQGGIPVEYLTGEEGETEVDFDHSVEFDEPIDTEADTLTVPADRLLSDLDPEPGDSVIVHAPTGDEDGSMVATPAYVEAVTDEGVVLRWAIEPRDLAEGETLAEGEHTGDAEKISEEPVDDARGGAVEPGSSEEPAPE